jgi:uncharacterized protein (TIGR03435 family)
VRLAFWTAGVFLLTLAPAARAQNEPPKFEVATIKLAPADGYGNFVEFGPGDGINLTNMTLKGIVGFAWNLQPFQVSGGPPWIDSTRYVITAKPDGGPKSSEIPAMVQALLADRFQLAVHHGTQELPIYALVLARRDGKLGSRLTESKEGDCVPFDRSNARPHPGAPRPRFCGNSGVSPNHLIAIGIPIANLAPMLQMVLGRTVIDKTGLKGNFDVNMEWSPDETQAMQGPPDAPKPAPADNTGPSIFSAIQEQLGLKLESRKGPVDVLIVDHAERPSEN